MGEVDPHVGKFDNMDFSAERWSENLMAFTIQGNGIFTRCYLDMNRIIELRTFLDEEIESWLSGDEDWE